MPPLGYQGGTFRAPLELSLPPLASFLFPAGDWQAALGRYTSLEWYDANTGLWRATASWGGGPKSFSSDGTNFRVINRTGGPMGAIVTNAGSGYTSAPVVTASAGNSTWRALVGGALNTTITITTAGTYTYPPLLIFPPAPSGGITPTAICALSAGAINSVTVLNRGAGLAVAPVGSVEITYSQLAAYLNGLQGNRLLIVKDPRETLAGGGVLTCNTTLAGSGTITGVLCTDPGTAAQTSLPTLTFSGGGGASGAATVIMNWAVTGFTVDTAGVAYGNALPFKVTGVGLFNQSAAAAGDANPQHNLGLTQPRNFLITGTSTAGGAVTATGAIVEDAGWGIQRVPNGIITAGGGALPTTAGAVTMTVGGVNDTTFVQQRKL